MKCVLLLQYLKNKCINRVDKEFSISENNIAAVTNVLVKQIKKYSEIIFFATTINSKIIWHKYINKNSCYGFFKKSFETSFCLC